MKLKTYQQGGGLVYTPFIPEQWASSENKTTKSSSDEDDKLDPLDKELLGLMKDQNLLPSDVEMIYSRLVAFQRRSQSLSGLGGTNSYRSIMPGMLQIMNLISKAKYSKSSEDKIVQQMMSENAGNEFALDGYGWMYVKDKEGGEIKKIKPTEFDAEKYLPLSNSQLLYLREKDPSMAFNDQIFVDMRNMVGMTSISKEIDRIIKAFGTDEGQKYLSKEAAEAFTQMNLPNGIYKLSLKVPAQGLKEAYQTIWDQLPANMQNLLKIRAAVSGDIDPKLFIRDIVEHNTSTEQKLDYDVNISKAAGINTDPNKTNEEKLQEKDNYQIRFAAGQGMWTDFALTPTAAKINEQATLIAQGLDFGPMLNMKELPLSQMNLQQMLFGPGEEVSALATSVRTSDVTFGNKLLDYSELPTVMYNHESLTSKVYLPYRNENGHYVPDFDKFANFNAYMEDLKNNPNMSVTERNGLLQKHHLSAQDIIPSEDGKSLRLKNVMPFLAFSAYAGDDTLKLSEDNKRYLSKVSNSKGRTLKDAYNKAVKYNDVYAKKDTNPINRGYHKSEKEDFWEGIVFIPCPDAFYAYNSTKNQPVTRESLTDISRKVMTNNLLNEAQRSAMSDPNYEYNKTIGQFR